MTIASKSVAVSAVTLCATACEATPFRGIAMSPSDDHRTGRLGGRGHRKPRPPRDAIRRVDDSALVQPVEPHRAAGQDPMLGLRRYSLEAIQHHLRRAGEEAVRVRVVGRPQDLMRADIIGEHLDAALDRFERNPAIALEKLARPGGKAGIVEALIVEVTVHPVEPGCHPAAARFEEPYTHLRMALAAPTPDHAHAGEHHLHRMGDDVLSAAALEAVDP